MSDTGRLLYSLYGVIEHSGTLRSGHYTAYVKLATTQQSQCLKFLQCLSPTQMSVSHLVTKLRCSVSHDHQQTDEWTDAAARPRDGRWFHVSDTSVTPVKLDSVLHCQAYILFYERIA